MDCLQLGWTALHLAAREGHLSLVGLLLESGAEPLSKTNNGRTAMWYAAAEGQTQVLSLLMKRPHDAYSLMDDRKVLSLSFSSFSNRYFVSSAWLCCDAAWCGPSCRFPENFNLLLGMKSKCARFFFLYNSVRLQYDAVRQESQSADVARVHIGVSESCRRGCQTLADSRLPLRKSNLQKRMIFLTGKIYSINLWCLWLFKLADERDSRV